MQAHGLLRSLNRSRSGRESPVVRRGSFNIVLFALLIIGLFIKGIIIVPNQTAVIIERLGKYRTTLLAGFHVIIPVIDRKAYVRSLKEIFTKIQNIYVSRE